MALKIDELVAHKDIVLRLANQHRQSFSATYLFAGPSGVGKKLAARALAQILLCEVSEQGCGTCGSCLRMNQLTHEGYLEIAPEGSLIKVEHAQEVLQFFHLQALQKYRVVVIDEAHRLNLQAGNMLLKLLEEPPEKTIFILVTSNPSLMLPTIKSRARVIRFRKLSPNEQQSLRACPSWMIPSSRGQMDRLDELLNSDSVEAREEYVQLLSHFFSHSEFIYEKDWRQSLKNKNYFLQMKSIWSDLLRDLLFALSGKNELIRSTDQKNRITEWLQLDQNNKKTFKEKVFLLLEALFQSEQEAVLHRDPVLWMEEQWLKFHKP